MTTIEPTEVSNRREKLLAELEPHVDYLDADSLILWGVVRALAAEVEDLHLKSMPAAIDALAGLVGWAQMILGREDLPASIREDFAGNHRLTTALLQLSARGR